MPLQDGGFDAFGRCSTCLAKGSTEASRVYEGSDAPVVKKRHLPLIFFLEY